MWELKIISPTDDKQFLKNIEFNYEELKTALSDKLEKYNNLHYDETQIKEAKTDRAALNKFKTAIETRRKEIKAKCMAPYLAFEEKIKDLVSIVDKPILAIDTQVKAFEDKKKALKRAYYEDFFNGEAQELKELLPFEKILNEKWLNATYPKEDGIREIFNLIGKTRKDLATLAESVDKTFIVEVKNVYLNTLDLGEALRRNTFLQEQKRKQEEYAAVQAAKQIAMKAAAKLEQPEQPKKVLGQEVLKVAAASVNEPKQQIDFRVWVTAEQKALLRQFLRDAKIKYGAVK